MSLPASPVNGRILVRRLPPKSRTRGGVLLPETYEGRWGLEPSKEGCAAEVLAVPSVVYRRQKRNDGATPPSLREFAPEVQVGDHVLLHRYAASPVDKDGHSYVEYRHILARMSRATAEKVVACVPLGGAESTERE